MKNNYFITKLACYTTNVSMSIIGNVPPLLFLTFRELYGISYSLLGLLILVNFFTQLLVDLTFSFFSHKFNIKLCVRLTPVITIVGLVAFALAPVMFPNSVYTGLVIGTVIFASASGLSEVLISPVIAAIPAKNPERAMSALHSIYAWGVVFAILLSTLFITLVGDEHWQIMIFAFCIIPLISAVLFLVSEIPDMQTPERISGALAFFKNKNLWLCVFAIFLGGAAECTMAQWASGYIEKSLGISKLWGDVFGVALFGLMLGIGRSTYAKIGKNIEKVLFLGAIGAFCCYIISVFTPIPIIGLFACGFTGFCVSMLWPGSLIAATDRIPDGGVFIYAMMAAGGDLGASVVPQLVGIITDTVSASEIGISMAESLSMSAEQLGMKAAMLCGSIFPFIGIFLYLYLLRQKRRMNAGD